ncbi:sensor histidine kinase [Microbacterium trichothecenolyticum]|nr:histidine kinase [Microbacterium trichothecenolyticum]
MSGDGREHDGLRAISLYVHATHVILAVATVALPTAAFIVDPRPFAMVGPGAVSAIIVGAGGAFLVAATFAPHHRLARWLQRPGATTGLRLAVLAAAVVVEALLPPASPPHLAEAVPIAWALLAVTGGFSRRGMARLLASAVGIGIVTWTVDFVVGRDWEAVTLIVAALLTLGVFGQDVVYTLAIELDDLRTREAERAVLTERRRFAGDLHDIQGQHLGLITVESELVRRLIARGDYAAAAAHAERVQSITIEALDEMHRVVHANREVRLDEEIANAMRVLRSAGISARRNTADVSSLDDETDRLLGLTVREAITNVLKHTRARTCSIEARYERRQGREGVSLVVVDAPSSARPIPSTGGMSSGTGLKTLAERYRRRGGTFAFDQSDGGRLVGWLPLANPGPQGDAS